MKQDKNLIKNKLPLLKGFTFYRQRFDACPHFMFFVGDAHGSDANHSRYPFGQRITCAYFSKNTADWYHPFIELEYTADKIMNLAKQNHKIADEMIAEFKPWEEKFYQKCLDLKTVDLKKLSKRELVDVYQGLAEIYTKKLNPSPLIDGFALSTDTTIAQKVELFLEKQGLLDHFVEYFESLTSPTFMSFLQQEELAFLKLIKKIAFRPEDKEKLLKQHQKEFFWIHNNYVNDRILDLKYFTSRLKRYKTVNVDQKIKELQGLVRRNESKKRKLISKLGLSKEIVIPLDITDKFSYWQDERKKGTFWATHYFTMLLEEIARRTKYSLQELKYAMPTEIEDLIAEKIDRKKLQERFEGCFLVWTLDTFDICTDEKIIQEILEGKEKKEHIDKEIRGMSVSLGKATGTVKIVESVEQLGKVQKGDILVAVMTRPDYVIAMEKAAGFVTDEGGLTCHAAIVARELGVPCIVGTRIATKTLKDGNLVEVDANHGIVRILKS